MQTLLDKSELYNERYNTLYHNINSLLTKYQQGDELEIRFGYYDNEYFRSSISYQRYNNLLNILSKDNDYTSSYTSNTIHMYSNGIREIKTVDEDILRSKATLNDSNLAGGNIIIKKNKKTRIDNHDLGVRIALSNEKQISELPSGKYMKKTRQRHTFVHESGKYRIDLTIDTLPRSNQCQCEIEFLNKPDPKDVIELIDKVKEIL